jgi:type II secretory pathway component GspD/PulD (secretin)
LGGCSDLIIDEKKHAKEFKLPTQEDIFHDKSYEPITRIETEFVSKYDVNNHEIPAVINDQKIVLKIKKHSDMANIFNDFPLNVKFENSLLGYSLPNITLKGSPSEILDKMASLTNSYWNIDSGIVTFTETKTIIYRFPVFSENRLQNIYNISSQTEDLFGATEVKIDVFDEIEKLLTVVLTNNVHIINVEETTERVNTKTNINKDGKQVQNNKDKNSNETALDNILGNQKESVNTKISKEKDVDTQNNKNDKYNINLNTTKNKNVKKNKKDKTPAKKIFDIGKEIDKGYNNNIKENLKNRNGTFSDNTKELEKSNKNSKEISNQLSEKETNLNQTDNTNESKLHTALKIVKSHKNGEGETKIAISKESGIIVAEVTRKTERYIDTIIEKTVKNTLGNMILLDIYILSIKNGDTKTFTADISALINNVTALGQDAIAYGSNSGLVYSFNNIKGTQPKYIDVSAILNYVTDKSKTKIISNPKMLTLSNIPSRLKSTTDIPYLEPEQVSVGGSTDSQLSYSIKYVHDGMDIAVLNTVIGEDILMGIGITLNQYLGDKTVNAGELGDFNLPIQSPRIFNTTMRVKAGDMVVFGGIDSKKYEDLDKRNMFIPTGIADKFETHQLIVVASPKLFKFIDKNNLKEVSKMKDSIIKRKKLQLEEIERLNKIVELQKIEEEQKLIKEKKENVGEEFLDSFSLNNDKNATIKQEHKVSRFADVPNANMKQVKINSNNNVHNTKSTHIVVEEPIKKSVKKDSKSNVRTTEIKRFSEEIINVEKDTTIEEN